MISKSDIAANLKAWRLKSNMSVRDVVSELLCKGISISEKTVYGWERGHSQPDADKFVVLCELYGIHDLTSEFGYNDGQPDILSAAEMEIIDKYRKLPEVLQSAVKQMIDSYLDLVQNPDSNVSAELKNGNINYISLASFDGDGVHLHSYPKNNQKEIDRILDEIDLETAIQKRRFVK